MITSIDQGVITLKDITLERSASETKFFWRKGKIHPDQDTMSDALTKAVFTGRCSGSNFDRFDHGEIVVYYNKIYHKFCARLRFEHQIKELLMSFHTDLDLT